jgi:nitrate reductase NapE component
MPFLTGIWPVIAAARVGVNGGWGYIRVNSMPSSAI